MSAKRQMALGTVLLVATLGFALAVAQENECPPGSLGGFIVAQEGPAGSSHCLTDPKIMRFGAGGDLHLRATADYPMPPYPIGTELEIKALPAWGDAGRPLLFGGESSDVESPPANQGRIDWPPRWEEVKRWEARGLVSITPVTAAPNAPRSLGPWGACSASCGAQDNCGAAQGQQTRTCTPGTGSHASETCDGQVLSRACSVSCPCTCDWQVGAWNPNPATLCPQYSATRTVRSSASGCTPAAPKPATSTPGTKQNCPTPTCRWQTGSWSPNPSTLCPEETATRPVWESPAGCSPAGQKPATSTPGTRTDCTCSYGSWSPSASTRCAGTTFTQTRSASPASCTKTSREATGTNPGQKGTWSNWSCGNWSSCGNNGKRTRTCHGTCSGATCGAGCDGSPTKTEQETCTCYISAWTPARSTVCVGTQMIQTRTITPSYCLGTTLRTVGGTKPKTNGVFGPWGEWGPWSDCENGQKSRSRSRICTPGDCGGSCVGHPSQTQTADCGGPEPPPCTYAWSPETNTVCDGQHFTQYGTRTNAPCDGSPNPTRPANGSKSCPVAKVWRFCGSVFGNYCALFDADAQSFCLGSWSTQDSCLQANCTPTGSPPPWPQWSC